jgi:hypothetical protein
MLAAEIDITRGTRLGFHSGRLRLEHTDRIKADRDRLMKRSAPLPMVSACNLFAS